MFSNESDAKKFIEICKKPFLKEKIVYDYRGYELYWTDWILDEYKNEITMMK